MYSELKKNNFFQFQTIELIIGFCIAAKNLVHVYTLCFYILWLVGFMMFNTTFSIISVISWRSVLLVEETGGPRENH
jgi:hypothetical protein